AESAHCGVRLFYQCLPKSSQPAKIFLTTDGHGWTRIRETPSSSVLIRVHPWLDRIGCGFAALRNIRAIAAPLSLSDHDVDQLLGHHDDFLHRFVPDELPDLVAGERSGFDLLRVGVRGHG